MTFDGSSSVQTGSVVSYAWGLDGDGTFEETSSDPTLVHACAEDGVDAIRLLITDGGGREFVIDADEGLATAERTISVFPAASIASSVALYRT